MQKTKKNLINAKVQTTADTKSKNPRPRQPKTNNKGPPPDPMKKARRLH
jgi:hypothetical protein